MTNSKHRSASAGRARITGRGRQVEEKARDDIRVLLDGRPRDRDLLIEYLHLVQDGYGYIAAAHLAALAEEMSIPMAEAYEVATFYAHFDVVKEDQEPPPALTVRVCDSLSCAMRGSGELQRALQEGLDPERVRVVRAPCMGRCDSAPVAEVGHRHLGETSTDEVVAWIDGDDFSPLLPRYPSLEDYRDGGGYQFLQSCRSGEHRVEDIIELLKSAGLRGLGGAGFPAGQKWEIVRSEDGPRYLAVNGDEGEPGTFKDRHYLEQNPHRFLEGVLLAAWAIEAESAYIYLRDEYPALRHVLRDEIDRLIKEGLVEDGYIILRRGAGAYICGEESAMIESLEGKRGYPRERPPYVAEVGLFGRPTLVNNVETLFWVREIIEKGADWFADQGRHGAHGLRSYSVSGRVAKPGVYLAPAGITLRELLDEYCGGMQEGHRLKGYLPGGASGGILPAALDDLPLDFGTLEEQGCFIGSAAIMVLSDRDDMNAVALNVMRFFADESCGQCSPCRIGTEKLVQILERREWDAELVGDLCQVMRDASICGLGQAASNPIESLIRHFPNDMTGEVPDG
jgi:formate dehydrogenase|tara:strand:+ start:229 stop:1932 length:1704 start_codon:yes stop_codon:yes gene_type:complete